MNNPCNVGFRVPTDAELTAELTTYAITNGATAYANGPGGGFKFVLAGQRHRDNATLGLQETFGYYWSSSVSWASVSFRYIDSSGTYSYNNSRSYGMSVRCIKD